MIEKILKTFKNKSICVFGGTGTIGSIIIEHLRKFSPKTIRVFSNDENSLWECQQKWKFTEFKEFHEWDKEKRIRYLLGDIRNYNRVYVALRDIDYVFNCAAVKHVPFAEYNPLEAVNINIHGLENIIKASVERGVEKLLHISTDKAVEATTLMGATKFIGELIVQVRWTQNPNVGMIIVRLGNVWDSRGSIIQLIKECEKSQKPIPITHPDMTRYFMTPIEVQDFILKAFREGYKGDIFVPKLKIVKLMDIIHGQVGIEYPSEIIGIRKGEKLNEKLLTEEELSNCEEHETYWIIKNDKKVL